MAALYYYCTDGAKDLSSRVRLVLGPSRAASTHYDGACALEARTTMGLRAAP